MKNRQPYNLDRVMIVYNIIQIICCTYLFYEGVIFWTAKYKLFCEPIDYSETKEALHTLKLIYFYYILKILDLADTVFFVLRKKFNQVSFLHVYHHTGMVMMVWGAGTYLPGGHGSSVGLINSFVHVIMYSYYLLTVAAPSMKNSVTLKKFVTQIQILQFLLLVLHVGSIVFIPDCAYPRWVTAIFLPQNLFMLILFVDFYIKNYIKKPKQSAQVKKIEEECSEIKHNLKKNGSATHFVESKHDYHSELILRNNKTSEIFNKSR
ncbi:unnamed protein product [Euphydryas editha]|uniref:Elongation of very long chain fatty acids protein n=1 Tax=Euphydryas editha TaxID=104508 RepID=A0AAU9V8V9_EUPED|nr:unnamed protein product [Euphydryas editha]